ncbi:mediator of RNA polymerase II transcription subunit 27-like isoform X2 [Paramacrobiotus metropolitanus]|uniref:mediator of RNA polymerase II transcription subunit 27-like isoform X2 n=1 Tax=Paramacrobiotus metropolitanus TaxID=2943436 RepID=UPI00244608D7|nr:mediator of RNA polymerase II transcription subunit 27-like isoform X2 [Paramacrobiotus metropolitanus]
MASEQSSKLVPGVLNEALSSLTELERSIAARTAASDRLLTLLVDSGENDLPFDDAVSAFQDALLHIQSSLSDVEKSLSAIPAAPVCSLGTSAFLTSISSDIKRDHDASAEDNPVYKDLYEELISVYASHDRYREYSLTAWNSLSAHSFRKSSQMVGSRSGKGSLLMNETVRKWLEQFMRTLQLPALHFTVNFLPAMGTVIEVVIDRSFRAVIFMRGIMIEAINIRGIEENFNLEPKSLRPLDLWSPSEFEVYRILTNNATSALLYFCNPLNPDHVLKPYLIWLNSLATLFSLPCRKCGKYLDRGMPSTWRDYKRFEPYHESCRMATFTTF